MRGALDRRREGAVEPPREHRPHVDVVAPAVVPEKAVVLAVRRDREAARALAPRDRDAPRRDAPRGSAGREIRHPRGVRGAGLRSGVLPAVDRAGLVPAPHERALEPAVRAPERQHVRAEIGRPGGRPACRLAGARGRRALRAERQPHRPEGVGTRGRHALGGGPEPARPVAVAVRPGRSVAPVARAQAVLRQESVEAVRDAGARLVGVGAGCGRGRLRRTSAARPGRACGRRRDRPARATARRIRAGAPAASRTDRRRGRIRAGPRGCPPASPRARGSATRA